MGTEDFSHIKPVVESGGGAIKPLAQAWGEQVATVDRVGAGHGDIQPAGLYSTAPYVPPKPAVHCKGKNNTCASTKRLDSNGLCGGCRMTAARWPKVAD